MDNTLLLFVSAERTKDDIRCHTHNLETPCKQPVISGSVLGSLGDDEERDRGVYAIVVELEVSLRRLSYPMPMKQWLKLAT